ncbi:MAG: hypothetical protein O7C61_04990 [SAR324 cluster bacterium]|nr:hypothetical protein [SAR324 cluster bacterium]
MNRLFLSLLMFLLIPLVSSGSQEIGAFFTKVNTYVYSKAPGQGKRILVRPRQAFAVAVLDTDGQDRLWLQIVHPKISSKIKGTGWIPLAPHELRNAGNRRVEIFDAVFEEESTLPSSIMVRASNVELLNLTQASEKFPQITWQKVKYVSEEPLRLWIRGTTGIFRPGKTSKFLRRVYVEMVSRNLPKEKLNRLLAGVVRVGDDTWEVERALGRPLRVQSDPGTAEGRVTWEYYSLVVHFKNDVVDQIN